MAFEDRRNRISLPFVPDSKQFITIPPGGKILQSRIILAGTVTIAGESAPGTVVGEGGPINLIQRIKLFATAANGSRYPGGTIVDCTPRGLLRYAIAQHNGKFIGEQSGSTLGNGASGTYAIYLSIPIYFADATLRNNIATALNADITDANGNPIYASLQLEVDTGDVGSCFSGNNGGFSYNLTLQYDDDRLGVPGDTNVLFQEEHVQLVAAAQARMLDVAMPQSGNFTQWLVMTETAGTAYVLADTVLQRLTATSGTFNFDEYAQDIRQKMLDDEWLDPSQSGAGLYFIDFTNGTLNNSNPAAGIAVQYQVANPSGSNQDQLHFYTRRWYQPIAA